MVEDETGGLPEVRQLLNAQFDELVRRERRQNLRLAVLLAGDVDAGHDLLQTAHEDLYRRFCRHGPPDAPERYLRTCLVRAASRSWRLRSRRAEVLVAAAPEIAFADTETAVLARQQLLPALKRLTPRQRSVLALRYFADFTEAEAADLLGCSVGTVKTTAHRALKRLRADRSLGHLSPVTE